LVIGVNAKERMRPCRGSKLRRWTDGAYASISQAFLTGVGPSHANGITAKSLLASRSGRGRAAAGSLHAVDGLHQALVTGSRELALVYGAVAVGIGGRDVGDERLSLPGADLVFLGRVRFLPDRLALGLRHLH